MTSRVESTAQMMRAARAAQSTPISSMHSGFLYNSLQDLRPVLLIEFRDASLFASSHIRDSLRLPVDCPLTVFEETIRDNQIDADRVFFLDEDSDTCEQCAGRTLITAVHKTGMYRKVYFLKGGFRAFQQTYPFLCVPSPAPDVVYFQARARYPTELLAKAVYFGGVVHLSNVAQLGKIGIRTLIDCGTGITANSPIPEIHLKMSSEQEIDFESAVQAIDSSEKPVFLYCLNGDELSAAVAAAYLCHVKSVRSEHAFAYIVSKRPGVTLKPEVFLQLQNFRKAPTSQGIPIGDLIERLAGAAKGE